MKNGCPTVKWISLLVALVLFCSFELAPQHTDAQAISRAARKVSPDVLDLAHGKAADSRIPLIIQFNGTPGATFDSTLTNNAGRTKATFGHFNARAIDLPAKAVEALAARPEVGFISFDRDNIPFGHVSLTTGADAIRSTNGTNTTGLDGSGIGIAVLDSGIDANHTAFLDRSNNQRVIYSRDFTGEGRTDDLYGHGTHVASIAAGNGRISNAQYTGIAPNANVINLRVLGVTGSGNVSAVLSALDWVLTNRSVYNIRVVNMSLGAPAVDSYKNDPVCRAVRRLVDAGVVVVAAVGNNGINSSGQKIYGQVHSPGNEPSAITVGAANTYGTDQRRDDVIASYSSRGPTRSAWIDAYGLKHYDNLIKPDLAAPGNKLIYAEAPNNYLVTQNPSLDAGVSPTDGRRMMYMNGSSMATPIAAGAAALLLQVNPTLTPNMVKLLLMYTAQPLAGYNMLEQGAGEINIEGAVRLARMVRSDLTPGTAVGTPLLSTSIPPTPQTTIAGQTFNWSQGLTFKYNYATGTELITRYQGIYRPGVLVSDGVFVIDGGLASDRTMLSNGVVVSDGVMVSDGTLLSNGFLFLSSSALVSDGVLVSDSVVVNDGVLVSDAALGKDSLAQAMSATNKGDPSRVNKVQVDTGLDCLNY